MDKFRRQVPDCCPDLRYVQARRAEIGARGARCGAARVEPRSEDSCNGSPRFLLRTGWRHAARRADTARAARGPGACAGPPPSLPEMG